MTNQKGQLKLSQKICGPVTMDMFKMICSNWLKGFFYACPKWFFFDKKNSKNIKNFSSETLVMISNVHGKGVPLVENGHFASGPCE
jgi:hypothetical protein